MLSFFRKKSESDVVTKVGAVRSVVVGADVSNAAGKSRLSLCLRFVLVSFLGCNKFFPLGFRIQD